MKKIKITLAVLISTITLLFFASCNKFHRDKYVGNWDFVTVQSTFDNDMYKWKLDTIYYVSTITEGKENDELIICCKEENGEFNLLMLRVDMRGKLYQKEDSNSSDGNTHRSYYPIGQFEGKDKVHIELYGGATEHRGTTIDGIRKEGGENE